MWVQMTYNMWYIENDELSVDFSAKNKQEWFVLFSAFKIKAQTQEKSKSLQLNYLPLFTHMMFVIYVYMFISLDVAFCFVILHP